MCKLSATNVEFREKNEPITWTFGPPGDHGRFRLVEEKALLEYGRPIKVGQTALRVLRIFIDRASRDANRTPISPNDVARVLAEEQNLHLSAAGPGFYSASLNAPQGTYTFSDSGGANIRPFHDSVTLTAPFTVTNLNSLASMNRTQAVT
jgi:hypothetical protein